MAEIEHAYNEHTIKIGPETHMRFKVEGPIINDWFDNFQSATDKIDDAQKKHAAQARQRISLPVITESGADATITGVHAGNGKLLGLPSDGGYRTQDFYPAVEWIRQAIADQRALLKQADAIAKKLEPYRMGNYRTPLAGKTHEEQVARLIEIVELRTKEAAEREPRNA